MKYQVSIYPPYPGPDEQTVHDTWYFSVTRDGRQFDSGSRGSREEAMSAAQFCVDADREEQKRQRRYNETVETYEL